MFGLTLAAGCKVLPMVVWQRDKQEQKELAWLQQATPAVGFLPAR